MALGERVCVCVRERERERERGRERERKLHLRRCKFMGEAIFEKKIFKKINRWSFYDVASKLNFSQLEKKI